MNEGQSPVVLHIGLHKTGTTAIQSYLHAHAAALNRDGILYPEAGRYVDPATPHQSHHLLAWSVVERFARKYGAALSSHPWTVQLTEEVGRARPRLVVLSSEFFWPATEEEVARLRAYLGDRPVKVVLYVRNLLFYFIAGYKQVVKTGEETLSFSAFCRKRLALHADLYDFDAVIRRWAAVFGAENLEVRLYDKVKGDLLGDFARVAGFGPRPPEEMRVPRQNESPPDAVIRLIRLMNLLETRFGAGSGGRPMIHRMRRTIVMRRPPGRVMARLAMLSLHRPLLTGEDVAWLREHTAEMQARFLANHVAPEDRHYFRF